MSSKKKLDAGTEPTVKPYMAWIMKHDLISSCVLTALLGLSIGGVSVVLEWLLV